MTPTAITTAAPADAEVTLTTAQWLRHWPYHWRHTSGACGDAYTEDAITAEQFSALLDKWNAAGGGQWTFHRLDPKGLPLA